MTKNKADQMIEDELSRLDRQEREKREAEQRAKVAEYEAWANKLQDFNALAWPDSIVLKGPSPDIVVNPPEERRFLDLLDSETRKKYPMSSGLIDYFPDALALVSYVSWRGNEKHNPGKPLHHARGKSMDHDDCVIRHHTTRHSPDDGVPLLHMAEESWRSLAMLQEAMEKYYHLSLPRGARDDRGN